MEKKYEFLSKYAVNLNELAAKGKLDPVIGRDEEIRRVLQILSRRTKNNPILVGEPGVGKTAIAEALAQKIAGGEVPYKLNAAAAQDLKLDRVHYDEAGFRFALNADAMATEKLAEGIRAFVADAVKLEQLMQSAA